MTAPPRVPHRCPVPSGRVVLAAVGVAFLTSVLVYVLLRLEPNHLTAVATAVLAVFAGVQVTREILSSRRRRATTERRLAGVAWLARRSCEVTLRSAPGIGNSYAIAFGFSKAPGLDRLQRHFREVLALSSAVGGTVAEQGKTAFEGFLAAADRFNEMVSPTTPATASLSVGPVLCEEALGFLNDAVVALEQLAPRRPHEPNLPARDTLQRVAPPSSGVASARLGAAKSP